MVFAHTPTDPGTALNSTRTEVPQETSRSKYHISNSVGHLGPLSDSKPVPPCLFVLFADDLEGTEAHPHVYFAEALTLPKALERLCCFLLHK